VATPVTYAILNQLDIVSEIEGRGLGSPGILGRIGGYLVTDVLGRFGYVLAICVLSFHFDDTT